MMAHGDWSVFGRSHSSEESRARVARWEMEKKLQDPSYSMAPLPFGDLKASDGAQKRLSKRAITAAHQPKSSGSVALCLEHARIRPVNTLERRRRRSR